VFIKQRLQARLRGVNGNVHGGANASGAVTDGGSHRADARGQLLLGERPSAGPHLDQFGGQRLGGAAGLIRQPGAAGLGQDLDQLRRLEAGQQDLALQGPWRRETGADLDAQCDDLGNGNPGNVHNVGAIKLRHR
jgi:hypothetical protein